MNKILAIAIITVRSAIRSKVVLALLALLLLAIIGLPATIEGDGTAGGYVRILLTYTLGAVSLILSLATLWAGCAAVADDITYKQIHMVLTKPVSPIHVWLGKWTGLMVLNAFWLGFSGLVVAMLLTWNLDRADLSESERAYVQEQVLVALQVHAPALPDVEAEAAGQLESLREAGSLRLGQSERQVLRQIRQTLWRRAFSAGAGETIRFEFSLPAGLGEDRPLYLDYQLLASDPAPVDIPHHWTVGLKGGETSSGISHQLMSGVRHRLALHPGALGGDGNVTVRFENRHPGPLTVLIEPLEGFRIMTVAGSFAGNLGRALLVLLCQLGLLAAIGVTAGSLFSLPVAAFVSLFVIILLLAAPYVRGLAERDAFFALDPAASASAVVIDQVLSFFFKVLHHAVAPLRDVHPLEDLGVGHLVSWHTVARVFAQQVLLYGGLCAVAGSLLFSRRDLGAVT